MIYTTKFSIFTSVSAIYCTDLALFFLRTFKIFLPTARNI